ncbi:MAG TPA: hypothetical protein VMF29_01010, partial [Candidatus Edwardsbacteria bacterium]|nr:hypothetical protein [Candidatus Edwardsbacteria bacterium]
MVGTATGSADAIAGADGFSSITGGGVGLLGAAVAGADGVAGRSSTTGAGAGLLGAAVAGADGAAGFSSTTGSGVTGAAGAGVEGA